MKRHLLDNPKVLVRIAQSALTSVSFAVALILATGCQGVPGSASGVIDSITGSNSGSSSNSGTSDSVAVGSAGDSDDKSHPGKQDCDDRGHHHDGDDDNHHSATPTPSPSASSIPDAPGTCYDERFTQPSEAPIKSLDILFVTDTSGSMVEEKSQLADKIDHFVNELPREVDYQFAVMPAHGSRGSHSGRLFSYRNNSRVLSSKSMSLSTIRSQLKSNFLNAPSDYFADGGEEGLYSLNRAMDQGPLTDSKAKGFFRENAALMVIFVADENDICAIYPNGVTPAQDFEHLEAPAKARDCAGITPESVYAKVKSVTGNRPLMIGGILHTSKSFRKPNSEDEYGWGYMELIQLAGGTAMDIADRDYSTGLKSMGSKTASTLQLLTRFALAHHPVDASTLGVKVDGNAVASTFDAASNEAVLDALVAGRPSSIVDAHYCLMVAQPSPSPSPSPSVTVTPSPSPTVSVTPEPTPSPSVTVTPSPSPSVTVTPDPTPSPTVTTTPSPSPTVTVTPDPTPTVTTTPSPSPTVTVTPDPTPSPSPTVTTTPSPTPTTTVTPSPSPTVTPCSGPACNGGVIGV